MPNRASPTRPHLLHAAFLLLAMPLLGLTTASCAQVASAPATPPAASTAPAANSTVAAQKTSGNTTSTATSGNSTAAKPDVQAEYFSNWPAGASPKEVGKRVAEDFLTRRFDFEVNPTRRVVMIYPENITWYGSLTLGQLIKDDDLLARLSKRFDYFLTPDGAPHIWRDGIGTNIDGRTFSIVPAELYIQAKDQKDASSLKYLEIVQTIADAQWANPREDGLSRDSRFWTDDMYMLPIVETQAYRATKDPKYLDRAALTMVAYLDSLQQPDGLFFHSTTAPYAWSRANGWIAAGMAELLRSLPADHPKRARILEGYQKMMALMLKYQDAEGLWNQLIDHPEAWPETSGSAMIDFAMITGVKNGWLDAKTYGPAARKGWLGLVSKLDENAKIREVCIGTNRWTQADGEPIAFYLNRPRETGNLHGQAPMLWAASALLR